MYAFGAARLLESQVPIDLVVVSQRDRVGADLAHPASDGGNGGVAVEKASLAVGVKIDLCHTSTSVVGSDTAEAQCIRWSREQKSATGSPSWW